MAVQSQEHGVMMQGVWDSWVSKLRRVWWTLEGSNNDDELHLDSTRLDSSVTCADEFVIPCDHAGGTFWYHPHHHGSVSLQMGGGAMGVLIVEDRPRVHGIPDQISEMPELVLAVQVRGGAEVFFRVRAFSIVWQGRV